MTKEFLIPCRSPEQAADDASVATELCGSVFSAF